jgi:S1-C subfamily serine protease
MGFVNFPMDQFGVQKPSLKRIAKTPEIPEVTINLPSSGISIEKTVTTWMDVVLREPSGDEMSAYGVGFDDGGVLFTLVAENSLAAKSGFRTGDLIQSVNGSKIKTIQNLKDYITANNSSSKKHLFMIVRNQVSIKITVDQLLVVMIK